ncbi:hypothetical protein BDZ89DRAFT_975431 [Hymenopellis radicata]|nr:hypothetical protein BDZ89DRAFT_975431 [Hymenopellis radicata]
MSSSDVSGILGEYMLKGWVLTDRTCPNDGCVTPLLRSPNGRTPIHHFCARCDVIPNSHSGHQRPSLQLVSSTVPTSTSSASSDSHLSGTSTPPTEISSSLSSPTFALPPETAESRRRREQSDRASTEIGKRLLKGWTMMAEECPNLQCVGVPLVRPPRSSETTDPNLECVICATRYVINADWAGRQTLIPAVSEPIGLSSDSLGRSATLTPPGARQLMNSSPLPIPLKAPETHSRPVEESNSLISILNTTMFTLERTLQSLSSKLAALSDGIIPLDPAAIGSTADAITKTAQALTQVKQLHWNEMQSMMP